MKERPILFSAPMVRAILDGSKTQTRRVCKPAQEHALSYVVGPFEERSDLSPEHFGDEEGDVKFQCPYGKPGDRLWVRETWQAWKEFDMSMAASLPEEMRTRINYPANGNTWDARLRPSIHMPRWASRILLEIVSVRVERLHDISTEDICAEGLSTTMREFDAKCDLHEQWRQLWESINGAENYDSNPWVWVVEFKKEAA